jgi:GGDEF domain-containing protein
MPMTELDRTELVIAIAGETARASTPHAVYGVLTRHLPGLLGADGAAVYERRQQTREHYAFVPAPGASLPARFFSAVWPMITGGELRRDDAPPDSAFHALFEACGQPEGLVYVPVGDQSVLALSLPGGRPPLSDADWRLLNAMAAQATAAIERVTTLQRLHELKLEDPDTGLGNRRLVEVVLHNDFHQATRGEPLSVVGIRPREGADTSSEAPAGEVQRRVAELLRKQARGSDTVARLDDGIFIIVLRASPHAGAEAFLRRVLEAAADSSLNCAVTEYDTRFDTPQAMLNDVLTRVRLVQAH